MYLDEPVVYKGDWFLPSFPERKVSGTLTYNPHSGIKLELFGQLSGDVLKPGIEQHELIIGLVEGSRYVTLLKSFMIKSGGATIRVGSEISKPISEYCVNYFLVNFYADSPDKLRFNKAVIHFHNLDEWVGVSGFCKYSLNPRTKQICVSYKCPKPIKFGILEKGKKACFLCRMQSSAYSLFQKEIQLRQTTHLSIESSKGISIPEYWGLIRIIRNFISMGMLEKTYTDSFELFKKGHPDKILLFFNARRAAESKELNIYQMCFTYGLIKDTFQNILNNWFSLYKKIGKIIDLIVEQFDVGKEFSENNFLNMAQAVEAFHSILYDHPKEDKSVYKKKVKDIIKNIPDEHKSLVKERLSWGNYLTLRNRLEELVDFCSDSIAINKEDFVKFVVKSRNYYTHYGKEDKKDVKGAFDLIPLTKQIQLLLILLIFQEIEIPEFALSSFIERQRESLSGVGGDNKANNERSTEPST